MLFQSVVQLFYPHYCIGCGNDHLVTDHLLCSRCTFQLPETSFFEHSHNPVEKAFYGRIPVQAAASLYYFNKQSLVQELMFQLKYRGNRDAGIFLGRMMGYALQRSSRFNGIDLLLPLPLNAAKEFKRGYNQAEVICQGISEITGQPVLNHAITRNRFTESQTRQNRLARWQNMKGVFEVLQPEKLKGRHILLVDDVITTGATLEACGTALLALPGCRLSIAAAAYTI